MSDLKQPKAQVAVPSTRPLVFVGPTIPENEVRALLPSAEIRGPVRRGDLYTARLLRYSMFIVIDGVFTQSEAISPREVVDVISDGAVFLGCSSMGALRAVDCEPVGARGAGAVWRLFRRGALSSEDEVAVLFLPERAFPAVTVALVNVRFALREAVRSKMLTSVRAQQLVQSAERLHYADRTWPSIFDAANIRLEPEVKAALSHIDVKRSDAQRALKSAANQIGRDPSLLQRPRRSRSTFSLLSQGRARELDVSLGMDSETTDPAFFVWMLASGRAPRTQLSALLPLVSDVGVPNILEQITWDEISLNPLDSQQGFATLTHVLEATGDLDRERIRFVAICRAARLRACMEAKIDKNILSQVEKTIVMGHDAVDWQSLLEDTSPAFATTLKTVRDCWAGAKEYRRHIEGKERHSERDF